MEKEKNPYQILRNEEYKKFVESKGNSRFSADYLSWAVAWDKFKKNFQYCSYVVREYHIEISGNTLKVPYMILPNQTAMVTVDLNYETFDGDSHTHTETLAIRDHTMKAVVDPSSAQVENAIRRCVAKAVSMATGFGIELWFGEDLKDMDNAETHITGNTPKVGMITTAQSRKLDELMRDRNCTEKDKAMLKEIKDRQFDQVTEEAAIVIIKDVKEGIKNNKPITATYKTQLLGMINDLPKSVDEIKKAEYKGFVNKVPKFKLANKFEMETLKPKLEIGL
tara:strand:+ start:3898 stop:4737 length:840 start_codon:yes stop_codon:yes gene_type:complete